MSGAAGMGLLMSGCVAQSLPLKSSKWDESIPFYGLTASLYEEHTYEAALEGKIPGDLRGVLYRNGPALFDRGGLRKRALLDGDGMVQEFLFHDRGVRYKNRFVRTAKYRAEAAAGKFLYPTWSTQAPGGFFSNFWSGSRLKSQACVNVFLNNGRLLAFDESSLPYELDHETLETVGITALGLPEASVVYSAHPKMDPATGEWVHFGLHYGRHATLHITIFDRQGKLLRHQSITLPRYVYIHDFFVSGSQMLFNLQPVRIGVYDFLLGWKSLAESLTWKPEEGNLVMIVDREGTAAPRYIETSPSFMWHSVNAYEKGGEVITDFVGYEAPEQFIGADPVIFAVMEGRKGTFGSKGELRRYRIDLQKKTIRQEIMNRGSFEWPFINEVHRCNEYPAAYFARCKDNEFFWSGITRFDMNTGRTDDYYFEEGLYCSEPVFAKRPGHYYATDAEYEPGWLLTEVYSSFTKKSFLAIFAADNISGGPVSLVHLTHHVPFSFHGHWYGQ